MDEICQRGFYETDYIDSNNPIVNAIINTKYREAVDKGLAFIFYINDLSTIKLSLEDMTVIIVNALNNAIEASLNSDKKIIKFKMALEEHTLIISIKNTYTGIVRKVQNEYLTTKIDTISHGYGIKNIERAVLKNDGILNIKYDDEIFYLSIMIPQ